MNSYQMLTAETRESRVVSTVLKTTDGESFQFVDT